MFDVVPKMLLRSIYGILDLFIDRFAHGDVAGQAADDIGHRLCHEYTQNAEAQPGQQHR